MQLRMCNPLGDKDTELRAVERSLFGLQTQAFNFEPLKLHCVLGCTHSSWGLTHLPSLPSQGLSLTWPTSVGSPARPMGVRLRTLFIAALLEATAASTSVMMLPGPMAFTRTLCGAIASAIALHETSHAVSTSQLSSARQCFFTYHYHSQNATRRQHRTTQPPTSSAEFTP